MAAERVGLSYGSGRQKLRRGLIFDALLSAFDARIRIPVKRRSRNRALSCGAISFPVLLEPRCFRLMGFVPDCDAVYPACPEEIENYIRLLKNASRCELFYRDAYTFGLAAVKGPQEVL